MSPKQKEKKKKKADTDDKSVIFYELMKYVQLALNFL